MEAEVREILLRDEFYLGLNDLVPLLVIEGEDEAFDITQQTTYSFLETNKMITIKDFALEELTGKACVFSCSN